jgi:hypothetical protein
LQKVKHQGGVAYPGQTSKSILKEVWIIRDKPQKSKKKSLDGGVDYPGQTTKIEKKGFRWRCGLSGKTYQSIIISIFLNMFLSIIDKYFLIFLI